MGPPLQLSTNPYATQHISPPPPPRPSRAITFIDNHDTGSTLNHWPFPSHHLQVRARPAGAGAAAAKSGSTSFTQRHNSNHQSFQPPPIIPTANRQPQEGYAYILLHPGTPCVFLDHITGDGNLRKVCLGRVFPVPDAMPLRGGGSGKREQERGAAPNQTQRTQQPQITLNTTNTHTPQKPTPTHPYSSSST